MVFIVIGQLILLFLLSRMVTSELSLLFFKIFRSQKIAIYLMALLFLPGTIIHEGAHALMAHILFVRVGKMELLPQLHGNSLKLGSVQIGQTDMVRNFLIGIAPFVFGVTLLLGGLHLAYTKLTIGFNFPTILVLFLAFIIANTMYSSKKDMEGAIKFYVIVVLPIVIAYLLGVRLPQINFNFDEYLLQAAMVLAVPLIIDIAIIVSAKVLHKH